MKNRLSICIPTLNRGSYIGQTLDSIVCQIEAGVEVVIVDGGSVDETEKIVKQYQEIFPSICYVKKATADKSPSNEGFDRDCNYAVERASGDYCWLMTDDDLLKPGAIKKILIEIQRGFSLVIANIEVRNHNFTKLILNKRPNLKSDRIYLDGEWNIFVSNVSKHLTFVGAVIIKRKLWLSRNREKYFGSGFVHVGVIFDEPIRDSILVTASPLVTIRYGNEQWGKRAFQIRMFNWPDLIWSFSGISDEAKQLVCRKEPWKSVGKLLSQRAYGAYSIHEYKLFLENRLESDIEKSLAKLISVIPRILPYLPLYLHAYLFGKDFRLAKLKNSWKK